MLLSKNKNAKDLKKVFLDGRLCAELDHLLNRPPFLNGGKLDQGWMCREHSLLVACISALEGFRSHICWGQMYITGHDFLTGKIKHLRVTNHSWNAIEDFGFLDLSINLKTSSDTGWRDWTAKCMMQSKLYPGDNEDFHLFVAEEVVSFERFATKSVELGVRSIGYLGQETAILAPEYLQGSVSYVCSPLTDELRALDNFSDDIYLKAAWHVWLVYTKKARPLTELSQRDAWSYIAENYDGAAKILTTKATQLLKI